MKDSLKRNFIFKLANNKKAMWFMLGFAVWELIFHRLFTYFNIYRIPQIKIISPIFETSGYFAMNALGTMAVVLSFTGMLKITGYERYAPRGVRFILIFLSPLYLPLAAVSVFKSVSPLLVLVSYVFATLSVLIIAVLTALKVKNIWKKRLAFAIGAIELCSLVKLVSWWKQVGIWSDILERFSFFSQILYLILPVLAFFIFSRKKLKVIKPALVTAIFFSGILLALGFYASDYIFLNYVSSRTFGLTFHVPGMPYIYIISFFALIYTSSALIFDGLKKPENLNDQQLGTGLFLLFTIGLMPTHPYKTVVMICGVLYLFGAMLEEEIYLNIHPLKSSNVKENT